MLFLLPAIKNTNLNQHILNNCEVVSKLMPNPTPFTNIVELWCWSQTSDILDIMDMLMWVGRPTEIYRYISFLLSIIDFETMMEVYGCCFLNWQGFKSLIQDLLFPRSTDLLRITLSSEPSLDFSAFFSSSWDCFTAFNSFSNCLHSILAWISCCNK